MSFRRWIRRIKVYDERSRRMSDSFAIFITDEGFCVLKQRGLSGFPRRGHERVMRWDEIKETMEGQACADLFQSETLYRYLKFDDEGNWTEREVWTTEKQGVENGDEEPEMTATNSYTIEKREITYY